MAIFGNKKKSREAKNEANRLENEQFDTTMREQDPYNQMAGKMATDFASYYDRGGYKFDPSTVMIDDPGYAFRQQQGMQGIENSAMAKGGLMSGNALKASQNYGQELASQEYGNAYNRQYQQHRDDLSTMSSMFDWSGQQVDKMAGLRTGDPRVAQKRADSETYNKRAGGMLKTAGRVGAGIMTGGASEMARAGSGKNPFEM